MLNRQHEQERQITALGRQRGVAIHDIKLTSGRRLAYNDFSRSSALVDAGEHATLAYLDALPAPRRSALGRLLPLAQRAAKSIWALSAPRALPSLAPVPLEVRPAVADDVRIAHISEI
jgi:hypothetical protein